MGFCEHCAGQRLDRARVLRLLREIRREADAERRSPAAAKALDRVIRAVRVLEIPHLEPLEETWPGPFVH